MPTALTGSTGWTGLHPLQLGGPPLVSTWSRPLPTGVVPLLAHAYANDGVTPLSPATFRVLNRPSWKMMTANGGPDQITLEIETVGQGSTLWGGFVWGGANWGGVGLGLTQGNVIRLTEVDNPVSGVKAPYAGFVYSGIIEGFPDTFSSAGTKHGILLTPFAAELTRVATQLLYTGPTDVAQVVRDAVALTGHCFCDPCSVPIATGVPIAQSGTVDFRGQKVNQVLDTARSALGPTWYWHCDDLGRVWLQAQGSAAQYTLMGGQHYSERVSNGGEITDRINQVPAVGGLDPTNGSQYVKTTANGTSQAIIGVRTLDPPLQVPGVADQATLDLIANGVLGTLDQTWTRVTLKSTPATFPQRVHMSQPGGALVRFWEPGTTPMPETGAVAGYIGPFICQTVAYDGITQDIEAGSIPVTNQTDVDNLVRSLVSRVALNSLQVTAAALNLDQTLTGSLQSGTGVTTATGLRSTLWSLGQQEFEAIDPNGIVRAEMGNLPANGISPAQWGFRASKADGTPLFDSLGLIAAASVIATSEVDWISSPPQTFGVSTGTPVSGQGGEYVVTSASFSISDRTTNVLILAQLTGTVVNASPSGHIGAPVYCRFHGGALATCVGQIDANYDTLNPTFTTATVFKLNAVAAGGPYQIDLIWNSLNGTADYAYIYSYTIYAIQLGG
jgi:hypothetical protein